MEIIPQIVQELRQPTNDRAAKLRPLDQLALLSAVLGRKDDAVAYMREELNYGARFGYGPDFGRLSRRSVYYWMRDYPPFQELVRPRG